MTTQTPFGRPCPPGLSRAGTSVPIIVTVTCSVSFPLNSETREHRLPNPIQIKLFFPLYPCPARNHIGLSSGAAVSSSQLAKGKGGSGIKGPGSWALLSHHLSCGQWVPFFCESQFSYLKDGKLVELKRCQGLSPSSKILCIHESQTLGISFTVSPPSLFLSPSLSLSFSSLHLPLPLTHTHTLFSPQETAVPQH